MSQDSFENYLERLEQGDASAANVVFRRFARRLIQLAQSRINARIQQRVDPEDITQSVFRSFFLRQESGDFELTDWDGIWSLLVRIAIRKCARQAEKHQADKRDVRREQIAGTTTVGGSDNNFDFASSLPTPDQAASLNETLQRVMEQLNEEQQRMLVMRLQGYKIGEISESLGRTERSVHRLLARVRLVLSNAEQQESVRNDA